MFGPDITSNFLANNRLRLIVRSHEAADEGILWQKGGNCVTVFSASLYCGCVNCKSTFCHCLLLSLPRLACNVLLCFITTALQTREL